MIAVVDYGRGNLLSVVGALEWFGADVRLCNTPDDLAGAERIVLPGVGSFSDGMNTLAERNLIEPLTELVFDKKLPILGICLGMQLMAMRGEEGGDHKGLGWFEADVERLKPSPEKDEEVIRIPHMGWNEVTHAKGHPLFDSLPESFDAYFIHSYHFRLRSSAQGNAIAWATHGKRFVCGIQKENIVAFQFHPEKSQEYGLKILKNFLAWRL